MKELWVINSQSSSAKTVFMYGQNDDQKIKKPECQDPRRVRKIKSMKFIENEEGECENSERICPELVLEKRNDNEYLYHPVGQKIKIIVTSIYCLVIIYC